MIVVEHTVSLGSYCAQSAASARERAKDRRYPASDPAVAQMDGYGAPSNFLAILTRQG
jgi:hypothetical protein